MKRVTNNNEVAHLWAHQVQDWARSNRMIFRGKWMWSYAASIGRICTNRTRGPAALISNGSRSVTTSIHINLAFRAVQGNMPVFTVPSLNRGYGVQGEPDHKANLAFYRAGIEESMLKASRARVSTRWHLKDAERKVSEGNAYARYFLLKTRFLLPSTDQIEEKVKAQREAAQVKARACKLACEERRIKFEAEELPKWRRGEGYLRFIPAGAPTYLRIVGNEVESSTFARVPLSHVKKLLPLVHAIAHGDTIPFVSNGRTLKVGHFKLNSIDAQGTVKIGCHTILYREVCNLESAIGTMRADRLAGIVEMVNRELGTA